jgi:hypothetical protein
MKIWTDVAADLKISFDLITVSVSLHPPNEWVGIILHIYMHFCELFTPYAELTYHKVFCKHYKITYFQSITPLLWSSHYQY